MLCSRLFEMGLMVNGDKWRAVDLVYIVKHTMVT